MGPVLVPGVLKDRDPEPAALTMKTWASLKEAMDSIGSQVRQVLQVRGDLAMLQDDLRQQEVTWHTGEQDLVREVAELEAQEQRLRKEVQEGAVINHEVASLRVQLLAEKEQSYTATQLFSHDAALAHHDEAFLEDRVKELRARLEEAKREGMVEQEKAQEAEAEAADRASAMEQEAAELVDRALDEAKTLQLEESEARDIFGGLRAQTVDVVGATKQLESRLMPPGQLKAQVNAMAAHVENATKAIAQVQLAKLQADADCEARTQTADNALQAELAKLKHRSVETSEVCDSANQRRVLVDTLVKEACAAAGENTISFSRDLALAPAAAPADLGSSAAS